MEIKYTIPDNLQGVFEDMQVTDLQALITVMLEFAVSHKMLRYPETPYATDISNIRKMVAKSVVKAEEYDRMNQRKLDSIIASLDLIKSSLAEGSFVGGDTGMRSVNSNVKINFDTAENDTELDTYKNERRNDSSDTTISEVDLLGELLG